MKTSQTPALVIEDSGFFEDPAFVDWLNNGKLKATWHDSGDPGDFADTFVLVDPGLSGEGSDSDMPEHIWDQIVAACKENFSPNCSDNHIIVWLKP